MALNRILDKQTTPTLSRVSHVFGIYANDDGKGFYVGDEVDRYTGEEMTPDDLLQLADEIRAIAATSSSHQPER